MKQIFLLLSILFLTNAFGQSPQLVGNLSAQVQETSGLLFFNNCLWTQNDGDNGPYLYALNPSDGSIDRKVRLVGAKNRDWEELADDDDYVYVGDFGNNRGNRKNLVIYRVSKKELDEKDEVSVEKIRFSYPDQQDFEPSMFSTAFDCEAMVVLEDRICLFTKRWNDRKTYLYSLPKSIGEHVAEFHEAYNVNGLVTGADLSSDGRLCLSGYTFGLMYKVFVVESASPFDGQHFPADCTRSIEKDLKNTQVEAVSFDDQDELWLSAEGSNGKPAKLFTFKKDFVPLAVVSHDAEVEVHLLPEEDGQRVYAPQGNYRLSISLLAGKEVFNEQLEISSEGSLIHFSCEGVFLWKLIDAQGKLVGSGQGACLGK